jgi:hypothetical protein
VDGTDVVGGEEIAGGRLPVTDRLKVGIDAVDLRPPVAGRTDDGAATDDHRRHDGDDLRFGANFCRRLSNSDSERPARPD